MVYSMDNSQDCGSCDQSFTTCDAFTSHLVSQDGHGGRIQAPEDADISKEQQENTNVSRRNSCMKEHPPAPAVSIDEVIDLTDEVECIGDSAFGHFYEGFTENTRVTQEDENGGDVLPGRTPLVSSTSGFNRHIGHTIDLTGQDDESEMSEGGSEESEDEYECRICGKGFSDMSNLLAHTLAHNENSGSIPLSNKGDSENIIHSDTVQTDKRPAMLSGGRNSGNEVIIGNEAPEWNSSNISERRIGQPTDGTNGEIVKKEPSPFYNNTSEVIDLTEEVPDTHSVQSSQIPEVIDEELSMSMSTDQSSQIPDASEQVGGSLLASLQNCVNHIGVSQFELPAPDPDIHHSKSNLCSDQVLMNHESEDIENWSHTCKICFQSFQTKAKLKNHMKMHDDQRPYKCMKCGKDYKYKGYLMAHMAKHDFSHKMSVACKGTAVFKRKPQNSYKCKTCGKLFATSGSLLFHTKMHCLQAIGAECKPHRCSICGEVFRREHHLTMHMFKHTAKKSEYKKSESYECVGCKRTFKSLKIMSNHQRTECMPYKCSTCGEAFKREGHLAKHMFKHREKKSSYECLVCGKIFKTLNMMLFHSRKAHRRPQVQRPIIQAQPNTVGNNQQVIQSSSLDKYQKVTQPPSDGNYQQVTQPSSQGNYQQVTPLSSGGNCQQVTQSSSLNNYQQVTQPSSLGNYQELTEPASILNYDQLIESSPLGSSLNSQQIIELSSPANCQEVSQLSSVGNYLQVTQPSSFSNYQQVIQPSSTSNYQQVTQPCLLVNSQQMTHPASIRNYQQLTEPYPLGNYQEVTQPSSLGNDQQVSQTSSIGNYQPSSLTNHQVKLSNSPIFSYQQVAEPLVLLPPFVQYKNQMMQPEAVQQYPQQKAQVIPVPDRCHDARYTITRRSSSKSSTRNIYVVEPKPGRLPKQALGNGFAFEGGGKNKTSEILTLSETGHANRKIDHDHKGESAQDCVIEDSYKCDVCEKVCSSKVELQDHKCIPKDFKCDVCDMGFRTQFMLTIHESMHRELLPYRCIHCGRGFKQQSSLDTHMAEHPRSKPTKKSPAPQSRPKCKVCLKTFKSHQKFLEHKKVPCVARPFKCKTCGRRFKTEEDCSVHAIQHRSTLETSKGVSDKGAPNTNEDMQSKNTHEAKNKNKDDSGNNKAANENMNSANSCEENENSASHFTDDQGAIVTQSTAKVLKEPNRQADSNKALPHKCKQCGQGFEMVEVLDVHISAAHPNRTLKGEERPFKCLMCTKHFKTNLSRRQYMVTHI